MVSGHGQTDGSPTSFDLSPRGAVSMPVKNHGDPIVRAGWAARHYTFHALSLCRPQAHTYLQWAISGYSHLHPESTPLTPHRKRGRLPQPKDIVLGPKRRKGRPQKHVSQAAEEGCIIKQPVGRLRKDKDVGVILQSAKFHLFNLVLYKKTNNILIVVCAKLAFTRWPRHAPHRLYFPITCRPPSTAVCWNGWAILDHWVLLLLPAVQACEDRQGHCNVA
jgi:hypothetical protein